MHTFTPEENELTKKRALLERLKDRLADREEEMTDLRAELEQFEVRYTMEVGRLYADLDEIIYGIIEERRKTREDRGDLLSILLNAQDEDGTRMTDRQVRDESGITYVDFNTGHYEGDTYLDIQRKTWRARENP